MTGQLHFDSYADTGVVVAVELVNELPADDSLTTTEVMRTLTQLLVVDPPSIGRLRRRDAPGFVALAEQLRQVFGDIRNDDLDSAASRLNVLLVNHPAQPHLAKEDGQWRLHHHPVDVALVPMWTSICAEAMARMIGAGHGDRFGTCADSNCARVYLDQSKNASRRFCSTTCQNRVKAAAFRNRRADGSAND